MAVDTHELKERLMASDHEYRDLSTRHHELDERLHELSSRHFLSEPEQVEEVANQEAEAPPQGQDGRHRPPLSGFLTTEAPADKAARVSMREGPVIAGPFVFSGRPTSTVTIAGA